MTHANKIQGHGISGFMKLPYKNTRQFSHIDRKADDFYPRNPKVIVSEPTLPQTK